MSNDDELEQALDDLTDALEKNIKSRRRLSSEINHTANNHRKNGKVFSDAYVQEHGTPS